MKITKQGKTFTITNLRAQNLVDLAAACERALSTGMERLLRSELVEPEDAERYYTALAWERMRRALRRGVRLRSKRRAGGVPRRKAVLV